MVYQTMSNGAPNQFAGFDSAKIPDLSNSQIDFGDAKQSKAFGMKNYDGLPLQHNERMLQQYNVEDAQMPAAPNVPQHLRTSQTPKLP